MTQYDSRVEEQRNKILAEEWAKTVKQIHAHSLDSIWYDDRPEDTAKGTRNVVDIEFNDGSVMDIEYNNGVVKREIRSTGETVYFGEALTGQELLDSYIRNT